MPPQPEANPSTAIESSLPIDHSHILLTSFNSFLIVAIHNILYYRNIYPPATFLSTKAYNLPVHQNRHPKVCAWIRDAVDAVNVQLSAGHVSRIAIVIHSPLDQSFGGTSRHHPPSSPRSSDDISSSPLASSTSTSTSPTSQEKTTADTIPPGAVLERWLIDTSRFPAWPTSATSKSATATSKAMHDFARVLANGSRSEEAHERHLVADEASTLRWPDLDEQLRGALRRMASTAEGMGPLPVQGCTFTVAVELQDEGRAPIGHPQAWIPSEPNLQPASKGGKEISGEDIGGVRTRPIRAVEAGPLFFECWVEEGKAKEVLMRMKGKEKGPSTQGSTQPY
ncbi:DNA-binding protein [Chaetomium strumarium]|uniref:DNA-binding protein n=1 Tax=Chaetomium strumarium TaxID=1170767 RepID=A0AAJ0GW90_9PEZI|nr:DNA-binding protein [Chaetomium strumarium]